MCDQFCVCSYTFNIDDCNGSVLYSKNREVFDHTKENTIRSLIKTPYIIYFPKRIIGTNESRIRSDLFLGSKNNYIK